MSEFDDTSDMTDDECRLMLRVVANERDAIEAEFRRVVTERDALRAELNEIASMLSGVPYMDPPDGGSPSIPE